MTWHANASSIHKGAYIQSSDPGAVGAKVLWFDTTSGFVLKKRNDANSGWDTIANLSGLGSGTPFEMVVACSDEDTAIVAGTAKVTFRMPRAITLTAVRAGLKTPAATGTFTVDINEGGSSILSTKITIDATEKTSVTAAAAPVISDSSLADDAEITVDVDDDASGDATGLKITLIGTRT